MKTLGKLLACWGALVLALPVAGTLILLLEMHPLQPPGNTPPRTQFLLSLLARLVLVLALYPLARRLAGSFGQRAAAFIAFLFLAIGVNTTIEAAIFTTFFHGAVASGILLFSCEALLLGLALGLFFGVEEPVPGLGHRDWPSWTLRAIAAWLAFPVIYVAFGMCVAPIVLPYYRAGVAGLQVPQFATILQVQLLRSALFLLATLPLIALWKGSRNALWVCLGLAHSAAIGWYGLIGTTFFPPVLRITHSIEITADSFAYAAVLVLLFARPVTPVGVEAAQPENLPEVHA